MEVKVEGAAGEASGVDANEHSVINTSTVFVNTSNSFLNTQPQFTLQKR